MSWWEIFQLGAAFVFAAFCIWLFQCLEYIYFRQYRKPFKRSDGIWKPPPGASYVHTRVVSHGRVIQETIETTDRGMSSSRPIAVSDFGKELSRDSESQ